MLLAQVTDPATQAVKWAFQTFGANSSVRVRLDGTETIGTSTIPVVGELYWNRSYDANGQPVAKMEYTEYRDGFLVQRSVGDGTTFYCYSPFKNEYWVANYGSHGPFNPARYLANLVDDATAGMKGSATYLGRLLREVYVVNGYRAWIPGAQEMLLTDGQPPVADPVVGSRTYAAGPNTEYGLFWFGKPARKSLAFQFDVNGSTRDLKAIFFAEASSLQGTPRLVEWRADIYTNVVPAANNFVFIPPANARIIVGPRPSIG